MIHRPAPRFPTIFAMTLLALVFIPALVLSPRTSDLAPGLVIWLLFEGFLATLLLQHVQVRVEGGQLSFEHRRWPLATRRQTVSLADIQHAELEHAAGRGGRSFRIVLALRDGKKVPLTTAYFGPTQQQQRDLAELQRLIAP